jgi:hypothetical protein
MTLFTQNMRLQIAFNSECIGLGMGVLARWTVRVYVYAHGFVITLEFSGICSKKTLNRVLVSILGHVRCAN